MFRAPNYFGGSYHIIAHGCELVYKLVSRIITSPEEQDRHHMVRQHAERWYDIPAVSIWRADCVNRRPR